LKTSNLRVHNDSLGWWCQTILWDGAIIPKIKDTNLSQTESVHWGDSECL